MHTDDKRFDDPHLDHPPTINDLKQQRWSIIDTLLYKHQWSARSCLLINEGADWQQELQRSNLEGQLREIMHLMNKLTAVEAKIEMFNHEEKAA